MSRSKSKPRRQRGAVSRPHVLAAALELIDREGLDALSMRRLADQLDMEPMSLYKRVANKHDILNGVAELIWEEVAESAPPTDDWGKWLRSVGTGIRTALRDHPNAICVLASIDVLPPAMLEVIADQLERAAPAGLDHDDAVGATCAVAAYALGCAFAECSYCTPTTADDPVGAERQRLRRIARALPRDTPDRLIDTALEVCGHDTSEMFDRGLDLIVRGCEASFDERSRD